MHVFALKEWECIKLSSFGRYGVIKKLKFSYILWEFANKFFILLEVKLEKILGRVEYWKSKEWENIFIHKS